MAIVATSTIGFDGYTIAGFVNALPSPSVSGAVNSQSMYFKVTLTDLAGVTIGNTADWTDAFSSMSQVTNVTDAASYYLMDEAGSIFRLEAIHAGDGTYDNAQTTPSVVNSVQTSALVLQPVDSQGVNLSAPAKTVYVPAGAYNGAAFIDQNIVDVITITSMTVETSTGNLKTSDPSGGTLLPDYIVEGTASGDLINAAYTGDPEGDRIDNYDNQLSLNEDLVYGDGGNDTILGEGGNDAIYGGSENDTVLGGDGDDTIFGDDGADLVVGGQGNDDAYGGIDADSLQGDDGNDRLFGGDGNDTLDGGVWDDSLSGGVGSDQLSGGDDNDTLNGDAGDDYLYGMSGGDILYGGDGNDYISAGPDTPGDLNDLVYGGAGNDKISGGLGNDNLFGDEGKDNISGGSDNDTLFGAQGEDTLFGGSGTDALYGGDDNDSLFGEAGDDLLDGGAGKDEFYGGTGNDSITLGLGNDGGFAGADNDSLWGEEGNDSLWGDAGDDFINGGTGRDVLFGGSGADTLNGDDDRDLIYASISDVVDGGETGDDYDVLDLSEYGQLVNVIHDTVNTENGAVEFLDGSGNVVGTMTFSNIEKVIACFTPGAMVLTDQGEVAVEDLAAGDWVLTRDNGFQPIRWVGRRDLSHAELIAAPQFNPVFIAKGALGINVPERDMRVSPQHRMLMSGPCAELLFGEHEVLVAAKHLVGMTGIEQRVSKGISYIHILFDQHEVVRADGAWSESFQPGDQTLDGLGDEQRAEVRALFPELARGQEFLAARMTLRAREAKVLIAA